MHDENMRSAQLIELLELCEIARNSVGLCRTVCKCLNCEELCGNIWKYMELFGIVQNCVKVC